MNEGHAHSSPAAVDRGEGVGLLGDEGVLLLRRELEHTVTFFLSGEGCEDAAVETEVRVVHVRALYGSWKLECEATEEFDARVHTATILLLVSAEGTDEIKAGCYT